MVMPGRKQRDLMEVMREHSEMLPPEEVEQIQRQLALPSVPHKTHPTDLSPHPHQYPYQHPLQQPPAQFSKQTPPKLIFESSGNGGSGSGSRNLSKSPYIIPPLAPYFSRNGNGSADKSAPAAAGSNCNSSGGNSAHGNDVLSNSNFHLGRILSYPFPVDSHSSVFNMPAFQILENSLQNNNYHSTDVAGDGSFFPKTTSRQQF